MTAAAQELRRVLRPGAPVLIRSAFAGPHQAITLFRYLPEAIRILDTYPSIADIEIRPAFRSADCVGIWGPARLQPAAIGRTHEETARPRWQREERNQRLRGPTT